MNRITRVSLKYFGLFLLSGALFGFIDVESVESSASTIAKEKVYEKVDEMPRFPGCEEGKMKTEEREKCAFGKLSEFMVGEIKYPKMAAKEKAEGVVQVGFVVDSNGKITQVVVKESVNEHLDAEAIRVVKAMPDWTPGVHEGKQVNVAMVLPVRFALPRSLD